MQDRAAGLRTMVQFVDVEETLEVLRQQRQDMRVVQERDYIHQVVTGVTTSWSSIRSIPLMEMKRS